LRSSRVRTTDPAAVAVTRNACASFIADLLTSPVTRACQRGVNLATDQLLDELAS
jgi:hypothetical protein